MISFVLGSGLGALGYVKWKERVSPMLWVSFL